MADEPTNSAPAADPAVSVVGPDEGETIALGTTRLRILEDGSTTGHRLGIAESVLAPRTAGPPRSSTATRSTTRASTSFSGTVRFTVGEQEHDAPAGTLVMVPPGAPHTFANVSDRPAVLLSTFTPDLYVQYFRDLRDLSAEEASSPGAHIRTMSRYATEPATDFAPGTGGPKSARPSPR